MENLFIMYHFKGIDQILILSAVLINTLKKTSDVNINKHYASIGQVNIGA